MASSALRKHLGTLAAALLLAGSVRYMILPWIHPFAGPAVGIEPMKDFQLAVFYPVAAFLDGGNPYDQDWYLSRYPATAPFLFYVPATLLVHLPFGFLPIQTSALVYLILSLVLTLGLAVVAVKLTGTKPRASNILLITALILLSRPGRQNLLLGQVTLQAVLATYAAISASQRAPIVSALGLAVSLFKPTYGAPLAALMLIRGDRWVVTTGLTIAAAANVPLLWILAQRAGGVRSFAGDLGRALEASSTSLPVNNPATSVYRVDFVAVLSRTAGEPLSAIAQVLVGLLVLGIAGLAVMRVHASRARPEGALSTSIMCLAILLSVYHQVYDLLLLTLPFVALVHRQLPPAFLVPWFRWPALALYGLLAANYLSGDSLLRMLQLVSSSGGEIDVPSAAALLLGSINGLTLLLLFATYSWMVFRASASSFSRG